MTEHTPLPPAWPAHGVEPRAWRTNPDARDSSGRRPPREDRLLTRIEVRIPPMISALTPRWSEETNVALEAAAASIARLDQVGRTQLSALGGFLLRTESVATSKIERISADLDDFARAIAGQRASAAARETAAAATAITELVDTAAIHPIRLETINRAQRALVEHDPLERHAAGAPRTVQSWLGGSDFSPRNAVYVPPPPDLVPALLDDLVQFADRGDLSPIAQAALVHAQFESIHPYTDGNGRIGRALINAVLRRRQVTSGVVVPVASVLLAGVDRYFDDLDAYRDGDADRFVRSVADAARLAADEALVSARALDSLPEQWRARATPRRGSTADRLLDRLLDVPVLTDRSAAEAAGSSERRATDALVRLDEVGVLTEITGQRRNRVWVAGDVFDELDRLEARIGRRARPESV